MCVRQAIRSKGETYEVCLRIRKTNEEILVKYLLARQFPHNFWMSSWIADMWGES